MRYVITTPVPRWTGEVAGVAFAFGKGITDDNPPARVINYFRRRGYEVEPVDAVDESAAPAETEAPSGDDPVSAPAQADKKPVGRRGGTTSKETP